MTIRPYLRNPNLADYRPDPVDLAVSDQLEGWRMVGSRTGDGRCLKGVNADGVPVETSDLLVLDPQAGWARTHTGLWRLGRPAAPHDVAMPDLPPAMAKRLSDVLDSLVDRDAVRAGWRPSEEELRDAPGIGLWQWGPHVCGAAGLIGVALGHPRLGRNARVVQTSPVVAMHYDGETGFARTWSRWYRLGKRSDLAERAEFFYSNAKPETLTRYFEFEFQIPPPDLEPFDDLHGADQATWSKLYDWFEALHGEDKAEQHFILYVALRQDLTPQDAYVATDSYIKSRFHGGYN